MITLTPKEERDAHIKTLPVVVKSAKAISGFGKKECRCPKEFQGLFGFGAGNIRHYRIDRNCPVHKQEIKEK